MQKYDIYSDISNRTGGDVYLGVVGPVRTGKSTFITKFMEKLILPNISSKLQRQIATDEMPQSADGTNIMTTQPKFIPASAVSVKFNNNATANVRLIDSVGYFVEGALGATENDKPRLVKTPWSTDEIPFEKAAEIGTNKVITEHSTVGILVTCDGSFTDISRNNYVKAEEKCVKELKKCGKPFVIVLNSKTPKAEDTLLLCDELENKYGVATLALDVLNLTENDINDVIEKLLLEFPMQLVNFKMPKWVQCLSCEDTAVAGLIENIKKCSKDVCKMKDFYKFNDVVLDSDNFETINILELKLGEGVIEFSIIPKEEYFYKVISSECKETISSEYELVKFIKSFAEDKRKFSKIQQALKDAEDNGYGVVLPCIDEMNLEEPTLVKQGKNYGVKLKASAPSLHIVKVDVGAEVSPIVGTEKQGEDLVKFLMTKFEDNPSQIWETNFLGKSLYELLEEGLAGKINSMPLDAKNKMRKTLNRIVNENKGGLICILL